MSKTIAFDRINYTSSIGVIEKWYNWITQDLSETSSPTFNEITITSNSNLLGAVGIGTTDPETYQLNVSGDVNLTGDLYQNGSLFSTSQWTTTGSNIYFNTGNVGIGTNDPGVYSLNIAGDLNFTGDIYKNGSVFSTSQWTTAGSNIYFNTGNIGLGTTDPQSKLDIRSGDIYFLNDDTVPSNQIYFSDASLASDYFSIVVPVNSGITTGSVELGTSHSDSLKLYTEFGNIYLFRNGNVGIGTDIPQAKLHLFNNASTEYILLSCKATVSTDSTGIHFQLDESLPTSRIKTKILAVGDGSWGQSDLHFCLNNTNDSSNAVVGTDTKMIITKSGDVGIGTTAPGKLLDVNGDLNFNGSLYQNGTLFSGSTQWSNVNVSDIYFQAGNVGIGTNNPGSYNLNVNGSINTTSLYISGTKTKQFLEDVDLVSLYTYENVGIGTNASVTDKLNIDGSINFTGDLKLNGTNYIDLQNNLITGIVPGDNMYAITGVQIKNQRYYNYKTGDEHKVLIATILIPASTCITASATLTSFTFTVPAPISSFTDPSDASAIINGYTTTSPVINLENCFGYASGTSDITISFTSNNTTDNHVLNVSVYYA